MLLSIIIPVYNERLFLPEVLRKVEETPYEKEIIMVDDGSTDGTREYLRELQGSGIRGQGSELQGSGIRDQGAGISGKVDKGSSDQVSLAPDSRPPTAVFPIPDPRTLTPSSGQPACTFKIVFHEKNMGKGAALRTGMDICTGDVILIQDADLEYDPRDYGRLLEPIIEGKADVVYGSRFTGGPHRVLYFWHFVGNRIVTLLSNMFTNLNLTDMETGYKVFRREALAGVRIESNRFGFEPEITAKMAKKRARIYEVPISYYGRGYEEGKKITWKDGIKAFFTIVKYNVFR